MAPEDANVVVLGHITVEELKKRLVATEAANGFANRHLFVLATRSGLLPSGGNLDEEDVAQLAQRTKAAIAASHNIGCMRRTQGFEALRESLYREMADDVPAGLLGAVIARAEPQVLRLAVLYALYEGSSSIDEEHLESAWAVWSYCRASAAYIFGESLGNPQADRLLEALREAQYEGLTGKEQDYALGGRGVPAARSVLLRWGLAVEREEQHSKVGGRPSACLLVSLRIMRISGSTTQERPYQITLQMRMHQSTGEANESHNP